MGLKVFNVETNQIETIEEKDLDVKKHFHRNTHLPFEKPVKETKEEVEEVKETPKKSK